MLKWTNDSARKIGRSGLSSCGAFGRSARTYCRRSPCPRIRPKSVAVELCTATRSQTKAQQTAPACERIRSARFVPTLQSISMRIIYTAEALGDVAQILSFISERSPTHAPAVAESIDTAAKSLQVFPRAARFDRETNTYERPVSGLPLILVYTISKELIEIIAV